MVFMVGTRNKDLKPKMKIENNVKEVDIIEEKVIELDNIEMCSRCGHVMTLVREFDATKEFSCALCGKKLSKS